MNTQKSEIIVIGTVFTDYKGFAGHDYNPSGRNLGRVGITAGGVARNIAVNLASLGLETWFASTLNSDTVCAHLLEHLHVCGIHTDYLHTVNNNGTGIWLALLGEDGHLLGSVSQMPDISLLSDYLCPLLSQIFEQIQAVALEIDLDCHLVTQVMNQARQNDNKVYALPGNLSVIRNNLHLFQNMACFICNDTEAAVLTGVSDFSQNETVLAVMSKFCQLHGLDKFVITLGAQGSLYMDSTGTGGYQQALCTQAIDTTGAGDAFFSGTVSTLLKGQNLAQAVAAGSQIASKVIASEQSDCFNLL